jgi:hypothetical protein
MKNPLFPHSELSSLYHAITARSMEILQQNSGWESDVLFVWKHGVHVFEWLLHLEVWACHGPT